MTSSFVADVIIHCKLCFDPKCIGQVLKSSDIMIALHVIDGALSEYDVTIVTSSFVDDVIIHCQLCFDSKCIWQVLKSSDIIIPIQVLDGALS